MNRPHTSKGTIVATSSDVAWFEMLGGETFQGVGFTRDQISNLWKFYGFEGDNKPPSKSGQESYEDSVTVAVKHKDAVFMLLQEQALDFSWKAGMNAKHVVFVIKVPREFQGLEINRDHIPDLWNEKYNIHSWDALHTFATQSTNFLNTGCTRNLFRHVESDGLRLMALLSKFCEPGEDPVQFVAHMLAERGYDISIDEELEGDE